MRNLQEQVKKAFCYQKLFWPFTVWINCSSDFKSFENSRPSSSNFRSFSQCLEQFFLKVGQNNIGKKILFMPLSQLFSVCFHAVNYIQFTFRSHYLNDLTWRQIPNSSNWNLCDDYVWWTNFRFCLPFYSKIGIQTKVKHQKIMIRIYYWLN